MDQERVAFSGTPRYRPTRLLGAGGMGAVYEVEDRTTGGRVALKVMATSDASRLLRFKNEFRVMAELYHPNLVRLFDLGTHDGQWFFTMELVDGRDLLQVLLDEHASAFVTSSASSHEVTALADVHAQRERTEDAPVSAQRAPTADPALVVQVVAQILDALEFLHGHGIVHRDLKPSNILVDGDGLVRVLDFGLASRADRELRISQEGVVIGTLAYLSPEQLRGETASPASDLYALGCMLFQLLTGTLPFRGTLIRAMLRRTEGAPPRIDEKVAGVPKALADVVHRLMAREPDHRPTVSDVRAALGIDGRASSRSARVRERRASTTTDLFVGRQRELAIIAGCLERAVEGKLELSLVSGPSGIGKSAFAAMVARRAARLGFSSFAGRCYEREHLTFVAFDRVMDAIALRLRPMRDEDLAPVRSALTELERIFPALSLLTTRWRSNPAPAPADVDPRVFHERALDAFAALIAFCQRGAPVCIVLDDLQWADEESIALLGRLLDHRQGKVLIVALARPEAFASGGALASVLRKAERLSATTRIELGALHPGDALNLVEAVTGRRLASTTSAALVAQAEGNPFLVRMLAEHLATLPSEDRADHLHGAASADDLLREMMRALSPRADQVLALAAAAGGDVATTFLREASSLSQNDFDLAVGELCAVRLLKTVRHAGDEEGLPRLDLYQERIREVAYRRLDDEARRSAHLRLARALEKADGGFAEALVHHFTEAGERAQRRRYAIEAAEQAAAKLAFLRAARLFRIVLDDPRPGEDPLVSAARWERVGDLYDYAGLHFEAARAYEEAARRWDAAPEEHPERPPSRLRLRGRMGAHLTATERVSEGRAAFEHGLELMGLPFERSVPARLGILARLELERAAASRVGVLAPWRTDRLAATEVRFFDQLVRGAQPLWPWVAAEAALRAELSSRRVDDKTVLTRSMISSAVVPVLLGRCSIAQIQRAHERLDEADEMARAHRVPLGEELVQIHRSLLWLTTNAARARKSAELAVEGIARQGMSDSFDGAVARAYRGLVLSQGGADDELLEAAAHEIDKRHPNFVNVALAHAFSARTFARRGAHPKVHDHVAKLKRHLTGTPPTRLHFVLAVVEAEGLVAEGRFAEVLVRADAVERDARHTGAWVVGIDRTIWYAVTVDAAASLSRCGTLSRRDHARAESAARWLLERGVFDAACLGERARALLALAAGKRHEAKSALRRALALSSTNTNPYHRWQCLESARYLGGLTRELMTEAAELAAHGSFVRPSAEEGL
jgi:serine/threonine protein kinase